MKRYFICVLIAATLISPSLVSAFALPNTYTNTNFARVYHDTPASFSQDVNGNFYGMTTTGRVFRQEYVVTTISLRLQRFTIDDVYFYVSSKGVINATSDIQAVSIYLSYYGVDLEDFS